MRTIKIEIILPLIFTYILVVVASDNTKRQYNEHKFAFRASVLRYLDAENPASQFALEYFITPSFSAQIDFGVIIPKSLEQSIVEVFSRVENSYHKGYRIEGQLKYWFNKNDTIGPLGHSFHTSLHYFSINNRYRCNGGWIDTATTPRPHSSTSGGFFNWYNVSKNKYGVNALFGYQLNYHRLLVKPFIGVRCKTPNC